MRIQGPNPYLNIYNQQKNQKVNKDKKEVKDQVAISSEAKLKQMNKSQNTASTQNVQKNKKEKKEEKEQVTITSEAKLMQMNKSQHTARSQYVQTIKERVHSGEYEMDHQQTAQKLLEFWKK